MSSETEKTRDSGILVMLHFAGPPVLPIERMNTIANAEDWAVLFAHPGHELIIHGFMEQARPVVAILTDGSGSTGISRVDSTTKVLDAVGATPSDFYGVVTDQRCYAALLAHDHDFFIEMAE